MEWKLWPSLPLTERTQLPAQPGIYAVVDAKEQVWYVGRATNLNARWNGKGHHRYKQLSRSNNKHSYSIHWQTFPVHQLNEREQQYINLFTPHLNYSRVRTYARRATQPNQEISRLLKTINKKTLLFPKLRSVVLGYYTEVDEDKDACLKEYICIVIAINANDHDGPILNSYKKSFTKKGNSLKECWQIYESDCGVDNQEKQPALILAFVTENLVYEFVCYPNLIKELENHQHCLYVIEIANQAVLALKDPSMFASLLIEDGRFSLRSEDYFRYRAPDLRPINQLMSKISEG